MLFLGYANEISTENAINMLKQVLEPVQNLFKNNAVNANITIFILVLIFLSQFFHNLRHFSSHAKDRSTTHLFGIILKVCNSLRLAISTEHPSNSFTSSANFFPV